jgi:hypothetical protein
MGLHGPERSRVIWRLPLIAVSSIAVYELSRIFISALDVFQQAH